MRLEQKRPNVFVLTATGDELSALVGAARMTCDVMADDPAAPAEAVVLLKRLLRDYDSARARLRDGDGRSRRPHAAP